MKKAIFFIGLPGSGKTTLIENNKWHKCHSHNGCLVDQSVVSADQIKEMHPNYDPNNPEILHQWSVEQAEARFKQLVVENLSTDHYDTIVFDSGGINNNYSRRIMQFTKEKGYSIELHILDTPAHICLERINKRERKVPHEDVISKSFKMKQCIIEQSSLADKVIYHNYYKNKKLFLDMDGVLAEYQTITTLEYDMDYVNTKIFENAKPVKEVIAKIQNLLEQGLVEKVFILSASPNSITNEQKLNWINKHLPFPVIPYFVGNKKHKVVMLKQLLRKHKIDPKDCLHVDDLHEIIWEAVKLGVNAIHPSKFLTDY